MRAFVSARRAPHGRLAQTRWLRLLPVFVAALVLMALPVSAAAATDWYVNGATGSDSNNCTSALTACLTIQAAINKASSGDTIHVAAGAYPEATSPGQPLKIDKTLTLLGARSGVDARSRAGAESIVMNPHGTWLAADDVVIDGFTIQDSTLNSFTGYGIWMGGHSGTQILNNIFQDNIIGLGLSNQPSGPQVLVKHNVFQHNNQPGSASGTGIYSDQYEAVGAVKNVLIFENAFIGNNSSGIDISHDDSTKGFSDLEVSHNTFELNGRGILLFDTHNTTIHDNTISNSTTALSAAIRIFDNNSDLSIMHNDLTNGAGRGIRLSDIDAVDPGPPNPSSNVVINYNNIEVFANEGLLVEADGHVGTVDAECNWWNSSTGPTNPDNPNGTGEEVVGDADFTPWLLARAPGGACTGTAAPTPGKVTGGGQITGDPVFSSLGVLLSAPALVPSLADPKAQATFGFVAKCCAPTGNLEYNDHSMDVRIKAQSVTGLFISSPGTSCPATPGSKHARFTGMAAVIRSTGTTTEPYTVDVDDCSEPGTADTFGIKTTTYSNGPSVLIGGNIQIHK
jgi:parallel beta-helix repeat protein